MPVQWSHRSQAKYDADGSGEIDGDELMAILKSLGSAVTEQEVQAMVLEVDEDGSGTIDFDEFKAMVNHVGRCTHLLACLSPDIALHLTLRAHR